MERNIYEIRVRGLKEREETIGKKEETQAEKREARSNVKTNADVKIIYDVNSYQITKYIIIIIIIISIIVFLIIPTIYKLYKDGKKKHNIYF